MKTYFNHLYEIRWFMGSCSVWDKGTGKRVFERNFYGSKPYEAAQIAAEQHYKNLTNKN